MMEFKNPGFLLLMIPLLFIFLILLRRKRGIHYNKELLEENRLTAKLASRIKYYAPFAPAFLINAILIVALASPFKRYETHKETRRANVVAIVIDASMSMSGDIKGEGSGIDNIRRITHEFIEKRGVAPGDDIIDPTGIAAYSSRAGIITPPTTDGREAHKAIDVIKPQIFGSHTAIGRGVLAGLACLLQEKLGKDFDWWQLQAALDGLDSEETGSPIIAEMARRSGDTKNLAMILFTDGYHNMGMEPDAPLWLAKRLGLRVHFIAFKPTSVTGLSRIEQIASKTALVLSVKKTGGSYFESISYKDIAKFFDEVREMEKAEMVLETTQKEDFLYFYPVAATLSLLFLLALWEMIFLKIP